MNSVELADLGGGVAGRRAAFDFPDGAQFRIEIPSVEGPDVLAAVIDTAATEGLTINRVSQGSGGMLLSASELRAMAELGSDAGLEICMFVGPRAGYDVGTLAHLGGDMAHYASIRGNEALHFAVLDVLRAIECGIRGFLVADIGLLRVLRRLQAAGTIADDVCWKISAYFPACNSETLSLLQELGGTTANVPSDLTLAQLAELRAAVTIPLDLYVEASDSSGGTIRIMEMARLIRVASPLYVKFGLANAPSLYPSGPHLTAMAIAQAKAKVHRAAIALEWLSRLDQSLAQSAAFAADAAIPVVDPLCPL